MEDKKYLNEETYQKNNAKVKKIGKILLTIGIIILVLGIIFIIVGFINTGNSAIDNFNSFDNNTITSGMQEQTSNVQNSAKGIFGGIGLFALGGFIESIGFLLTAVGGILLFIAHRREITAYTAQQIIPVGKEIVDEVTPTISNAAGTIAKDITKGIEEAKNSNNK